MARYTSSFDKTEIYYEVSGSGKTALFFVHGWMGNARWWDFQREYFSNRYQIVQMDLAGHGKSGRARNQWSVHGYAEDIRAVANNLDCDEIILIGHSMSGSNVVEAFQIVNNVTGIVLVDTLRNLDQVVMPAEQVAQMFNLYRKNFKNAILNILPQYLFVKSSPLDVVSRLQSEFLANTPDHAIAILDPFYKTDIREAAKKITVPVRAINSAAMPDVSTELEINRKYFSDYNFSAIPDVGHYPMLENPTAFNRRLDEIVREWFF